LKLQNYQIAKLELAMSQERRKRRQKREQPKPRRGRKFAIIAAVVALFAAAAYLGFLKRSSRYDALAKCTARMGARMYGAYWCPHCKEQEEAFGSAFRYVNYVECGVKGNVRLQSDACKQAEIKHYPTWEFADGSRVEGKQSFEFLSEKTGCNLP
jgi:hypothetical protein